MKEKVLKIAQEFFECDIAIESNMKNIAQWDSLAHINLFMAIESELSISCNIEEIIENTSIEKIVELLVSKQQ
jgi:acyl carrier protein